MSAIYTVGGAGTVLKSIDNGATWITKTAPSAFELRAVWAKSETEVFAAPRNSWNVYRSINGGDTWSTIAIPNGGFSDPIPKRIQFFGNNGVLAIRSGSNSAFYISSDGGLTWIKQPNTQSFNDIVFINANNWRLVDNSGNLYETINAASTPFSFILNLGSTAQIIDNYASIEFAGLAGGAARRIQSNIAEAIQSIPGQDGTPEAFQMKYARINTYAAAGNNYVYIGSGQNIASRNILSGGTWSDRTPYFAAMNTIWDLFFIDAFQMVWVGQSGEIVITTDGLLGAGASSTRITPITANTLYAVHGTTDPCLATIDSVNVVDAIGGANGSITINASGITIPEYRIEAPGIGFDSGYQVSNIFNGLLPATYTIYARETGTNCLDTETAVVANIQNLDANLSATNISAPGATDGSIVTNIISGSGNYSYSWSNGAATKDIYNLPVGFYTVTITDNISVQQLILSAAVNEPQPEILTPYFEVPKINSFQFVHEITPDCDTFQDHDRILFCNQKFPYFTKTNYFQLVAQCDSHVIQFRSNLPNHEIQLIDYISGAIVQTYVAEKKLAYTGITQTIGINITNHGAGQSRVYYSGGGSFPFEVVAGDSFQIKNNADGFNGIYIVQSVETDVLLASDYLVINANYGIGAPSSQADGEFSSNVLNFDIWEFAISWGAIAIGKYYLKIRAYDDGTNELIAKSEPINLQSTHENAVLIEFTNNDNAFDIDYQTQIVHKIRVEAVLFKRLPASARSVLRNTDGSLRNLSAKPKRIFNLEFYKLPPYLHEKLSVAFDHDTVKVNNIEYVTEDGLQEPQYITRYPLANSQITIEAKQWFKTYNGDDLGGVDEQGFIIANDGFIRR